MQPYQPRATAVRQASRNFKVQKKKKKKKIIEIKTKKRVLGKISEIPFRLSLSLSLFFFFFETAFTVLPCTSAASSSFLQWDFN